MKSQRHKRKERISIILLSNYRSKNKELNISGTVFYGLFCAPFLLAAVFIALAGLIYFKQNEIDALRAKVEPYAQKIEELEAKQEDLNADNVRLADENARLIREAETQAVKAENQHKDAPNGYPYMGAGGILLSSYSAGQPYMSINTHTDGTIVAAGDGVVTLIGSSDEYKFIVEITHKEGYITRYLSNNDVQTQLQENAEVRTGDVLFTITVDNTQFDYQITFKNKPIDPITVIEAQG